MEYTKKSAMHQAVWSFDPEEPINGIFEDATASILEGLKQSEHEESSDDSELESCSLLQFVSESQK